MEISTTKKCCDSLRGHWNNGTSKLTGDSIAAWKIELFKWHIIKNDHVIVLLPMKLGTDT